MAISSGDGSIILTTKVDPSGFKKGLSSIKTLTASAGKALSVIGLAAASATAAITKMSVSAYADYEQLVGGVETLFKDSAQKVVEYANQAFFTAGVSANEYIQNVTSFSASLIKSTANDTEKAADIANMALIDISDNVNKMGSSMESVTSAYQGFAKQQYMLLDNLKLGYGGTKTEMERLLKDAQALTGIKYDINNLADVYSAIHAIQEQLGITGTTAKEAEKTISGSANMMKAAWQNVLTAISGGGDLDRVIENLVYSVGKYFENIVPVIERALQGIGRLIERIAPLLVQTVASALIKEIPSLMVAVYKMIIGLAEGIYQGIIALFLGSAAQISGVTDSFEKQETSIDNAVSNQNDLTDAVEETAKAQKKALAGFDKINKLTEETASDNDTPISAPSSPSGFTSSDVSNSLAQQEDAISSTLATIMGIAGGALVAIGLILIATGNIVWGVGFIIAGALTLGVSMAIIKDTQISETVRNNVTKGIVIVGMFALVVGLLLCAVPGKILYGLALVALGVVSLVGAVALNWEGIKEMLKGTLGDAIAIAGVAAIAFGVMMCVIQHWAIGIALIALGVASLVTVVAVNWKAIKEKLQDTLGVAIAITGIVAIVIGILLCVATMWVAGIGMIVTGALAVATVVAVNWNAIKEQLQGTLGAALAVVGIVAIVIGILLCVAQNWALGLGLIVAGGVAIATPLAVNWSVFLTKLKEIWEGISTYWNKNIAPWFTREKWASLINNIKDRFEASKFSKLIKGIWEAVKKYYDEHIKKWFTKDWWVTLANRIKDRFEVSKWSKLIKNIWEAVEKYYNEHVKIWFTKDKWVGLVNKIKDRFASSKWVKLIKDIWEGIKTFWQTSIAPWFTVAKWKELAGKCGDGLKSGFKNAINSIISYFETLINRVIEKFNTISFTVPDWVPIIHGKKYGIDISKISIPRLAEGAVIPPNREFLAVLGDQKKGTNIEAPATLIKQMVKEGLNEIGYVGGNETITIPLYLDGDVLFQAVVKRNQNYKKALGVSPLGI